MLVTEALVLVRETVPDMKLPAMYAAINPLRGFGGTTLPIARKVGGTVLLRRRDVVAFARRLKGNGFSKPKRRSLEEV
jgi:hypothetical protein